MARNWENLNQCLQKAGVKKRQVMVFGNRVEQKDKLSLLLYFWFKG